MKHVVKIVSLLLVFFMLLPNVVLAVNPDGVEFTATIDKPTLEVSEDDQTVVVTIAVAGGANIDLDGIGATVLCAEDFKTTVSNTELTFTAGDYNDANGVFGWTHDFSTDYVTVNNIMVITYTIPANTAAGTYELGIKDLQITKDWGSDWEADGIVTVNLTINGSEPSCCSEDDPHIINMPYSQTCTADEDHFYSWTAPKNGKATFAHDGIADVIVYQGDGFEHQTGDSSNNTITVDVTAGEKLTINAYGLGDGDWTWTATFEEEHVCTAGAVSYEKGANGTHTKVVACAGNCDEIYDSTVENCADKTGDHKCDLCGNVLSECADAAGDKDHDCDVCGKPGITECSGGTATCKDKAVCSECGEEYGKIDPDTHKGEKEIKYTDNGENHIVKEYCVDCGDEISSDVAAHNYGDDFVCDDCNHALMGWQQKDGAWYYIVNGKPVTGTVRVPYPTDAINGKTYGPNAEDVEYSKKNKDSMYSDAETALFIFGDDGKFQSNTTGMVGNSYAVNGMIPWHYGLVEINGEYYYFVGDEKLGNVAAEGDIYVSRLNGIAGLEKGAVYNFAGGKLSGLSGLVDRYGDGKLFYYENSKLMLGAGLIKFEEGYIYVRSNGQIATGKYWVAKTNGICEVGLYNFGDDGFMQTAKDPTVNGLVDGIYYKNGFPYYAGLIEIDGATYYINSAGEAVTGTYYVTKVNGYEGVKPGDKLTFAADGKLVIE